MAKAKFILLKETASTNTYAAQVGAMLPSGTVIATFNQTAGRGQRGNKWESEPGKNITISAIVKGTQVPIAQQFVISEAVSNAIVRVLNRYVDGFSVKWSNDIYYRDYKICGILIEHTLMGDGIDRTIIGVGVNINQMKFLSDAPNPISLAQILGHELPLEDVLHEIGDEIIDATSGGGNETLGGMSYDDIHTQYLANLYRKDGELHPFKLPDGTPFEARIEDVCPDGKIHLVDSTGTSRYYYFKEVAFVI